MEKESEKTRAGLMSKKVTRDEKVFSKNDGGRLGRA